MIASVLDPASYDFSLNSIPPAVAVLATLSLGVSVLVSERGSKLSVHFLSVTLAIAIWLFAFTWFYSAVREDLMIWWAKAGYLGVPFIPTAIHHFTLVVLKKTGLRYKVESAFAWLGSAVFSSVIIGTDFLMRETYRYSWGHYPKYEWLGIPFLIFFILVLGRTLWLYWRQSHASSAGAERRRARFLMRAFLILCLGAVDFLPKYGIASYPFGFVPILAFVCMAAWAMWRHRLLDITPAFAARQIVDMMADSLLVLDREGVVRVVNQAACRLFGKSQAECIGAPFASVCGQLFTPDRLDQLLSQGVLADNEVEFRKDDSKEGSGLKRTLSMTASLMRGEENEMMGFVCIIRDITTRKRSEKQLKELNETLEQKVAERSAAAEERAKELEKMEKRMEDLAVELAHACDHATEVAQIKANFLANMSHELRTPLHGIISTVNLLFDTRLRSGQRELVQMLHSSSEALLAIINNILDFSKADAGKMSLSVQDFNLRESLESVASMLAVSAQTKGVEVVCDLPPELPVSLRGDPDRLRQILLNLMGNAIKFTDQGHILIRAMVEKETQTEARVRIEVCDTGIGIDSENQHRLFQSFTQADTSSVRKYGGTGLGLAICKKLVDLMKGKIGVESAPGRGSVFWFTIPFQKQADPLLEDPKPLTHLAGRKVLVVDSHAVAREPVCRLLALWEMRSDSVSSGAEALAKIRQSHVEGDPYQVVLIDLQMPEMDGWELAQHIRAQPEWIMVRLVLLTTMTQPAASARMSKADVQAALAKPVRMSALKQCLNDALGLSLRKTQNGNGGSAEPAFQTAAVKPVQKNSRVLVVEDSEINQKMVLLQLGSLGYRADVVSNGTEALDRLEKSHYDLVFMDCQMPGLDGYTATAKIRKREEYMGGHVVIVAMTAHAMESDRERCLEAGMDDYIAKPFKPSDLAQVVARWDLVIDPEALNILRAVDQNGSQAALHDMIRTYCREAPRRFQALDKALSDQDPVALSKAAHVLKGSSGFLGAKRVQSLCARLENLGASGTIEGALELLNALKEEYELARIALESELDQVKAA